jgi:hypothetical protein
MFSTCCIYPFYFKGLLLVIEIILQQRVLEGSVKLRKTNMELMSLLHPVRWEQLGYH